MEIESKLDGFSIPLIVPLESQSATIVVYRHK